MLIDSIDSFSSPSAYVQEAYAPSDILLETIEEGEAEVMERKLFAVHATKIFPEDGVLKIGGLESKQFPGLRSTIHFALGELVRPVEGVIKWEDHPYAVVVPFHSIAPQCINLNTYDTFILGNLTLPPEAVLVLPQGDPVSIPQNVSIHFYDPTATTLRKAVERVIVERRGWPIRMVETDDEDMLKPADLNGQNINTPDFFAPLLKKYPYISMGLRFDALSGEAYRLGQIENCLQPFRLTLVGLFTDFTFSVNSLKIMRTEALYHLELFTIHMRRAGLPDETFHLFHEKEMEMHYWINILDEEIRLREQYGKTLIGASLDQLDEIAQRKSSLEELQMWGDQNHASLPLAANTDSSLETDLFHKLSGLNLEDAREFMRYFRWPYQGDTLWVRYGVFRYLDEQVSASEEISLKMLIREKWPLVRLTEEGKELVSFVTERRQYDSFALKAEKLLSILD